MYYFIYGLLYLVSLLPMRVLYVLSDAIFGIVYYCIRYRRKLVMDNLRRAFPEKTETERVRIAKKFYQNFIDSFIEVIKLVSADESWLHQRFTVDVRVLDEVYATGKSCQMHLGHTFNWEWGQIVLTALTKYKILVVYMPIGNKLFEKLFYRLRTRNGNVFLPAPNMREAIVPYLSSQYLLGLVADQSPGNMQTSYWIDFLGRPTAFASGPEKGARNGHLPVVFASIDKPRRGYYHATMKLACMDAAALPDGQLTREYVRYLESVIRQRPDMWLWSHRRWKHVWKDEYESLRIDEGGLGPIEGGLDAKERGLDAKEKEVFSFSGNDALNYDSYLGPILFEPSALELLTHLGSSAIQSVLEISCGTGRVTRHLRKYFPETTTLVASDISPDMLEVAKGKLMNAGIEFRVADAQQLPFDDESFDLVICQYGLMFLPDKLKGFTEAFRVLKRGGRFIFSTWDSTDNVPLFKLVFNDLIIPFFKPEDAARFRIPFSLYEPEKLNDLLQAAGFTNRSVSRNTFMSHGSSPRDIVDGLLVKHPIGRAVAQKDPAALGPMADEMTRRIEKQFGKRDFALELKAFFGVGRK